MKKNIKTIGITGIVIVILIILAIPKLKSSESKPGKQGPDAAGPLPVKAHITKFEALDNKVLTTGTVLANEEVDLKSEVPGKVTKILFKEGSVVNAGDLLVKINDADLQAQLQSAKSRLELQKDTEYRQKQLLEKEAISQEDYDMTANQLQVNQAEVELIKAQIDKTEIRAPFSGIIGLKNVSEGSFVTNSMIIASLQNINPIKIDFSIPERYSSMVNVGDEINFSITGSSKQYIGKVYAIEPKIDPVTRTLNLRALCANTGREILPGSFANVELVLKKIENAILIPSEALIPDIKGQKVFVDRNGKATPVEVGTGIRTDINVQLTSGVSEGDTIITSGMLQLRPGAPVTISEFE
ncbi:MAG TPA: efflux RND transporter periplasmic adaptor subunit [Ignavibacteriaceae bacterium]|nr:efflux RND transporter periplasmic adaptor subunit [Ignavibacteriaceae bacterium]